MLQRMTYKRLILFERSIQWFSQHSLISVATVHCTTEKLRRNPSSSFAHCIVHLPICPSVCSLVFLSLDLSICPALCPSVHLSIHLSVCSLVCPSLQLSVHQSVYLSICPPVYHPSSIHPFFHTGLYCVPTGYSIRDKYWWNLAITFLRLLLCQQLYFGI